MNMKNKFSRLALAAFRWSDSSVHLRKQGTAQQKILAKLMLLTIFSYVDLFGFLHQERSGYAARASAH